MLSTNGVWSLLLVGGHMTLLPGANIVYRSSFELEPVGGSAEYRTWRDLVEAVRSWVEKAPLSNPPTVNETFGGDWFLSGGEWKAPAPGYYKVTTARLIGGGRMPGPDNWAVQYEHGCDVRGRTWQTDIAVNVVSDHRYRMTVTTSHYMRPGFICTDAVTPMLTVPKIVRGLCESRSWRCFAGTEELTPGYRVLRIGDGLKFKNIVTDAKRSSPIIYVSRQPATGEPMVDAASMARSLLGAATVFQSESPDVDREIVYVLGDGFACFGGAVRVYYPPVKPESSRDQYRHRYYAPHEITDVGASAFQDGVVAMIVTRPGSYDFGAIESVQDVNRLIREESVRRFSERRAEASASANVDVYEELLGVAEQELKDLTDESCRRAEEAEFERSRREEAEEEARRQTQDARYWKDRAFDVAASERSLRGFTEPLVDSLAYLPSSPSGILSVLESVFGDRLAFTERGRKSLLDSQTDVGILWTGLFRMATTLHDVLFSDGDARPVRERFEEKAGLELAETEKRLTKKDNQLTALRDDEFNGERINVTPHVKFDKGTTRGYFDKWDRDGEQLVVVGYVGHLKTAGTRKIS